MKERQREGSPEGGREGVFRGKKTAREIGVTGLKVSGAGRPEGGR